MALDYNANPYYLRPGETVDAYNKRISSSVYSQPSAQQTGAQTGIQTGTQTAIQTPTPAQPLSPTPTYSTTPMQTGYSAGVVQALPEGSFTKIGNQFYRVAGGSQFGSKGNVLQQITDPGLISQIQSGQRASIALPDTTGITFAGQFTDQFTNVETGGVKGATGGFKEVPLPGSQPTPLQSGNILNLPPFEAGLYNELEGYKNALIDIEKQKTAGTLSGEVAQSRIQDIATKVAQINKQLNPTQTLTKDELISKSTNPNLTSNALANVRLADFEAIKKSLGIDTLRDEINTLEAERDAVVEGYNQITEAIRNEAITAGVAERRILAFQEKNQKILDSYNNQLNRKQNELTRREDDLKQQLGIYEREINAEREKQEFINKSIMDLSAKYPDAGISLLDDFDSAIEKASQSESFYNSIYKQTTSPAMVMGRITPEQLSPLARAIFNGTMDLKDIPASQRAIIGPELDAVGYTSAIAAEDRNSLTNIIKQLDIAMDLWKNVPDSYKGQVQGRITEFTSAKERDPRVQAFETQRQIVGQEITRLYEKGRLSDYDRIFYQNLMVNLKQNSESIAVAGNNQMISLLKAKLENNLKSLQQGQISVNPEVEEYVNSIQF